MKSTHLLGAWLSTLCATLALVCLPAAQAAGAPGAASAPAAAADAPRQLDLSRKPFSGDFDAMLTRRVIRIDIPRSRTLYYVDKGRERGMSAELARDFERWVNKTYAKQLGKRPLTVYIVPATRDQLLDNLTKGLADIAVGNLSVTEERLKLADFVAPDANSVNIEILVTGPVGSPVASTEALSGQTVHVRESSSYHASLQALNARLKQAGKPPVTLALVPDELEDEDLLEMVNGGLIGAIVVDQWKAEIWAQVLPKLKLNEDVVLREAVPKGWAIRKNSPQLQAVLNRFYTEWVTKSGVIAYRQKQAMQRVKTLNNSTAAEDRKRFEQMIELFRKYGAQYAFDPLMLAAQGYQESTLDQNKKSHVGAIGVMQIMPATGAELKVGDIRNVEANIHGGTKYMDQLMTRYFTDANFSEKNRTLFAFAAYNAGPGNIAKMRKEAAKRGLDPDKWFNNVEIVTSERIGSEPTTYVRNIYKYYVSYKLLVDAQAQTEALKQQVTPAKK
jgi:membrane-bound lytic murein transglycosylase MltF